MDGEGGAIDTSSGSTAAPPTTVGATAGRAFLADVQKEEKEADGEGGLGAAQRLLQEARAALSSGDGGGKEEGEEEDDPTLRRCAAVLKVVGHGVGEEEDGDGAQMAAIVEEARLWAKEGAGAGQGGGEEGGDR